MPKIKAKNVIEHRQLQQKALLVEARKIILKDGPLALNFSLLGKKMGLKRSSLYEYYESRSELLLDLMKAEFPEWIEEVKLAMNATKNPEKKIHAFFSRQLELVSQGKHSLPFKIASSGIEGKYLTKLQQMHLDFFSLLDAPLLQLDVSEKQLSQFKILIGAILKSNIELVASGALSAKELNSLMIPFLSAGINKLVLKS